MLGQMAAAIGQAINAQQALGLDLREPVGQPAAAVQDRRRRGRCRRRQRQRDVQRRVHRHQRCRHPWPTRRTARGQRVPARSRPRHAAGQLPADAPSDGVVQQHRQRRRRRRLTHRRGAAAASPATASCCSPWPACRRNTAVLLNDPRGLAAASPVTGDLPRPTPARPRGRAQRDRRSRLRTRAPLRHHLHVRRRRLRLGAARPRQQCAAVRSGTGTWRPARASAADGRRLNGRLGALSSTACPPAATPDGGPHDQFPRGRQRQRAGAWRCAWSARTQATASVGGVRPSPTPTRASWPTSACGCRARALGRSISASMADGTPRRRMPTSRASTSTRKRRG
jgi:hypothetical protein